MHEVVAQALKNIGRLMLQLKSMKVILIQNGMKIIRNRITDK